MTAVKKSILYLGRPESNLDKVKESLVQQLGAEIAPVFILAKDGPDAALKASNQKFDAVIVDPRVNRLLEGGFLLNFHSQQNTSSAGLIVVAPEKDWKMPAQITNVDQVLAPPCTEEVLTQALVKSLKKMEKSKGTVYAVDVKVLNALVKATRFVCGQFGIGSLDLQKPEIKASGSHWVGDVGASIAINSKRFQGLLVISFDEKCYLKLVSNMLGDEQMAIGPDNADAIGEISNMILGNAKSDFTEYEIAMSLPVLLQKGAELQKVPAGSAEILLPGQSAQGRLYLQIFAFPLAGLS